MATSLSALTATQQIYEAVEVHGVTLAKGLWCHSAQSMAIQTLQLGGRTERMQGAETVDVIKTGLQFFYRV